VNYLKEIGNNSEYRDFLAILAGLSRLFAEGPKPYLDYRIVENLFCRCFGAKNLAREDSSYDALHWGIGVGLKTFILSGIPPVSSMQKIAEFDKLSRALEGQNDYEIAKLVSGWRNDRIATTNATHGITDRSIYHVVARHDSILKLFVVPYDTIRMDRVRLLKSKKGKSIKSVLFTDGLHEYSFSRSKSTLMGRFTVPSNDDCIDIPVKIHKDPYEMLLRLADNRYGARIIKRHEKLSRSLLDNLFRLNVADDCVILPLYSTRLHGKVAGSSGLNHWNAKGRNRHPDEVYISIPQTVNIERPEFFPPENVVFQLKLPNGKVLSAKICQEGKKALMSNPNKDLGKWLLRDVLRLQEGTIVTREMLDIAGFDSVIVVKESTKMYRLELSTMAHYCTLMTGEIQEEQ